MKELRINGILICRYELQKFKYKAAQLFIHMDNDSICEDCAANLIGFIENTDIEFLSYLNVDAKK